MVSIEVDEHTWQILAIDGKKIGHCSMCGQCCTQSRPECAAENLIAEIWDGVPVMRCKLHGPNKPVSCAIWPLPDSELPKDCTMRIG